MLEEIRQYEMPRFDAIIQHHSACLCYHHASGQAIKAVFNTAQQLVRARTATPSCAALQAQPCITVACHGGGNRLTAQAAASVHAYHRMQ
jgi:hypothetical protein